MAWLFGILIIFIGTVLYLLFLTPYPFVWLAKRQKEEHREKGPEGIEELRSRTQIEEDVRYPSKYPNATFDYYQAKQIEPKRILVWVHGGSFIAGTSKGAKNFAVQIAQKGTIVCAINYAYAPKHAFPTQIQQVEEFLSYLPEYIARHTSTSELPIFLGGDSAGANIAALYACLHGNKVLQKQLQVQLQETRKLAGCLLFCGPYDFAEDVNRPEFKSFAKFFHYIGWSYLGHRNWMIREEKYNASPYHQITKQMPPLYIVDGKKYSFLWQGKALAKKAEELGIPVQTRFYESQSHEFQFDYQKNKEEANTVLQESIAFLEACTNKGETAYKTNALSS